MMAYKPYYRDRFLSAEVDSSKLEDRVVAHYFQAKEEELLEALLTYLCSPLGCIPGQGQIEAVYEKVRVQQTSWRAVYYTDHKMLVGLRRGDIPLTRLEAL